MQNNTRWRVWYFNRYINKGAGGWLIAHEHTYQSDSDRLEYICNLWRGRPFYVEWLPQ